MTVAGIENLIRILKKAIANEFENGNVIRAKWLKNKRIELILKLKQHQLK